MNGLPMSSQIGLPSPATTVMRAKTSTTPSIHSGCWKIRRSSEVVRSSGGPGSR